MEKEEGRREPLRQNFIPIMETLCSIRSQELNWADPLLHSVPWVVGFSVAASHQKLKNWWDRIGNSVWRKRIWGDRIGNSVFMIFGKKKTPSCWLSKIELINYGLWKKFYMKNRIWKKRSDLLFSCI